MLNFTWKVCGLISCQKNPAALIFFAVFANFADCAEFSLKLTDLGDFGVFRGGNPSEYLVLVSADTGRTPSRTRTPSRPGARCTAGP